jgi:nucleotide-binding universal stress UspA family protein
MNWLVGTIVVPSDGSTGAEVQLAAARALARANDARIIVAHVSQPDGDRGGHFACDCADVEASVREQVDALQGMGVRAELEILAPNGDLARGIAEAARRRSADLIVTRQSRGQLQLSGDVARRLMQLAECPVLVVPREA